VAPHRASEDQLLVNQLAKVGVKPSDVKTVLLSHMHCDHAGGLFLFKDTAEVYVNKDDFRQSLFTVFSSQDPNASGGTCRADVIEQVQNYRFLGNKDYKIAPGVTLIYLPGHSAGMMGLLVELAGGNYLFPLDILNMAANYRPKTVPSAIVYDSIRLMASVERVRELEAEYNAEVMFPHDMAQFETFKRAPNWYQ
jgi:glyoxylase-like metal-dependent hydrolase (beta-lactamase superfamily II)